MGTGTSEYDYFRSLVNAYIEQNAWRFSSDWNTNILYCLLNVATADIPESTSQPNINLQNRKFLDFLRTKEAYFVTLLHRCDFEDGMSNDAIEFVRQNMHANESVTCNWLNEIYGRYQNDRQVLCGILRTVSFLHVRNYDATFTPMIIASLKDSSEECQEAALMLVETIRSKECLTAVRNTHFDSLWIKDYADNIVRELTDELESDADKKN